MPPMKAAILTLCLCTAVVSAQGPKSFRARLSPVALDVAMQATVAGSGSVTATLTGAKLTLTPQQVADLEKKRLYVQLHSEKAPDGNLWGWLMPAEGKR